MATAITPSLRASLERLKHAGTVNGICLSWRRQVLVSLMPYEDFRLEQLVQSTRSALVKDNLRPCPSLYVLPVVKLEYLALNGSSQVSQGFLDFPQGLICDATIELRRCGVGD